MDYLNTKKRFRQHVVLFTGYVCCAIAIVTATLILLYQAYGFGTGTNGTVIQNGLTFISSQPNPAQIYVDGKRYKSDTNARLVLPGNIYNIKLSRDGYRDWQRTIEVDGGDVHHFDYPLLIPKQLASKKIAGYTTNPGLVTQSPDRRWLLVQKPDSFTDFELYDLKNPTRAGTTITLPDGVLTAATATQSYALVEWADDNRHVLLQHTYDDKTEFINVDRNDPTQSYNVDTKLGVNPTKATLKNKKYDQYYLYDQTAQTLQSATVNTPTALPVLSNVIAYKTYGDNTVLYATSNGAAKDTVNIRLQAGSRTATIRSFPGGSNYLLDLAKYDGSLYVVAGATAPSRTYVYKDPIGQLNAQPDQAVTPSSTLRTPAPDYTSFSSNAQFVVAENGARFAVYDIENDTQYNYTMVQAPDTPSGHATWMDGDRLTYTSGGKMTMFDYDHTNVQSLMAATPTTPDHLATYTPDYHYVYTVSPSTTAAGQFELLQTPLLTANDL